MGALKAALTAIFNANNYTSATDGIKDKTVPVAESNGLPSGKIGMRELSTLIGMTYITVESGTNLDNIKDAGFYAVGSQSVAQSITGGPTGFSPSSGFVIVFLSGYTNNSNQSTRRSYGFQIILYRNDIYYRYLASGTWGAWKTLTGV